MNTVPYLKSPVSDEKIALGSPSHEALGLDSYVDLSSFRTRYAETCEFINNPVNPRENHRYYFLLDNPNGLAINLGPSGLGRSISGIWKDQCIVLPFSAKESKENKRPSDFNDIASSAFLYLFSIDKLLIAARINGVYKLQNQILVKSNLRVPASLLSSLFLYKDSEKLFNHTIEMHCESKKSLVLNHCERLVNFWIDVYLCGNSFVFDRAEIKFPDVDSVLLLSTDSYSLVIH